MSDHHGSHGSDTTLAGLIRRKTGVSVASCYQCGKCAAGCPLAEEMDQPPCRVLRMLQLGTPELDRRALGCYSIWLCLSCQTCFTRCPKEVDLPRVMDVLRSEALARGCAHPRSRDILAFHKSVLGSVRSNGRLHEVGLVRDYKFRTFHLFQDVGLAPRLFAKGKLHLLPKRIRGRAAMARLFDRTIGRRG